MYSLPIVSRFPATSFVANTQLNIDWINRVEFSPWCVFFSKTRLRFDVALADAVAALGVINLSGIQRGMRYMWQARCAVYTFASLIRRVGCGAVALAVAILLAAICSASSIPADTSSILAVAACCRRMRKRETEREEGERDWLLLLVTETHRGLRQKSFKRPLDDVAWRRKAAAEQPAIEGTEEGGEGKGEHKHAAWHGKATGEP